MKRFYIGIYIFQTLVYGGLYLLAKYDTGVFTDPIVVQRLVVIVYIFSISVTIFYPILINKIRQKK
jgi:hypothetical protein